MNKQTGYTPNERLRASHGIKANRAAELDELDFSDDQHTPSFRELPIESDFVTEATAELNDEPQSRQVGLTEASMPGQGPTDDDLAPETLIHEDGARSQYELGGAAADQTFTIVSERDIGAGGGLDEAELARKHPLDGKPWDGDPDEPLNPAEVFHLTNEERNENESEH